MRVLIVDDHQLLIEAMRIVLEGSGCHVVGLAANASEALEILGREPADAALVDLVLPDGDGIGVGRDILARFPETKVVAFTSLDDAQTVRRAIAAGFHGFVTKDVPLAQVVSYLRGILDGQVILSRRSMRDHVPSRPPVDDSYAALVASQLTRRELEVLRRLAEGENPDSMASALSISSNTARAHIQSILSKLNVHSRLQAVAFAVRHQIVPLRREDRDRKAATAGRAPEGNG
jgi:two-component system nitrate/nitrite response regulator NarL